MSARLLALISDSIDSCLLALKIKICFEISSRYPPDESDGFPYKPACQGSGSSTTGDKSGDEANAEPPVTTYDFRRSSILDSTASNDSSEDSDDGDDDVQPAVSVCTLVW